MEKIENWDNIEAKEIGEFKKVSLGGHELIILDAEIYTSPSGNDVVKIKYDIAEAGEFKNFYKNQYESDTRVDKKWKGFFYQSLGEKSLAMFKGVVTAIENSNNNYTWNWDETTLIGKKVGGVFGITEYTYNGKVTNPVKCLRFTSIDKIKDASIPKVQKENGTYIDYEEYMATKNNNSNQISEDPFAGTDLADDAFAGIL